MSTTTRTARIACARSMPSSYVGIVEVAELAHQPLGVERPALGVTGRARERALVPAQGVGQVPHLRDLQVMAGDTFVVADRHLAPEREARLAERGVPGASGSREVLGRAGVVHRGGAAGRRDHRLHPLHGLGDVEVRAVELGDGGVEQLLVPPPELVDALDGAVRVGLEVLDHLVDGGAGEDPLRDRTHRVLDPVELLPAPGVRLVEVEVDAVEVARVQRVALASDRVVLGGVRRVLLDEVAAHRRVRRGRRGSASSSRR